MSDKTSGNSVRLWTPPQLAAITHRHGNLLVSAAAGSGKTAVLAERCAQLVSQGENTAPRTGMENLLVLTFTEAAATEMRSRIAAALHEKLRAAAPADQRWLRRQAALVDRADISTLHAFCMRILRQHFHQAQLDPAFDIVDQEESQLIQEEVLDDLLARWLSLPPPPPGDAADAPLSAVAFGTFYEAYAQGSPGLCRQMILTLHRMLASTAYPDGYQAAARGLYGGGAAATIAAFNQEVLQSGLRLARLATQRAFDEMSRHAGAGQMGAALGLALLGLDDATAALAGGGAEPDDAGTWARVREHLAIPWPKLIKTVKEIADFENLKKRHYQAIKERIAKLAEVFARDPAAMRRDLVDLAGPLETLLEMTRQFDAAFTAAKRADNRLDFADLERLAFNLLMAPGSLARVELCQRYHHVLVDEFQDINPLQAELLAAVSHPGTGRGNLFVVGDIKQSIYAFRLAQPDLFHRRELAARAALAAHPDAPPEYLSLAHNFRSHPKLLAAMNRIFERILTPEVARIDYAGGHELKPPPASGAGTPPPTAPERAFAGIPVEMHLVSMEAADEEDEESADGAAGGADAGEPDAERLNAVEQEAQVVAERIAALLRENRSVRDKGGMTPLRPRHIAILLRTMKNKAMIFARALSSRGIPVHADLSAGFFETPEVKDTLALLQVLDNAQQDIPLATVLLGPYGQFSHDDLARIRLAFDRKEVPFARAALDYPRLGAADGAPAGASKVEVLPELAGRLRELYARLERWRELLRARPLHEGLAEIFAQSKIFPYVAGLDTGAQRVANLQYLHQRALAFSTFKKQGLHRFLRFIERLRERESAGFGAGGGGDIGEAPVLSEASDVVRILSVHKSKGLEFPVVFVSGLGGKLQLTPAGPVLLHPDLGVGMYVADAERNVAYPSAAALRIAEDQRRALRAEELRLLYVAMTRARECLILSGHVGKAADIDKWRRAWEGHRGPLPEDVLLQGRRALDWLMPALATGRDVGAGASDGQRLTICWDPESVEAGAAQVVVHVHGARREAAGGVKGADAAASEMLARVIAGEPLAEVPADPRVGQMIQRVTGRYRFAEFAKRAAVQTVTFLKTAEGQREAAGEVAAVPLEEVAVAEAAEPEGGAEEKALAGEAARRRGIATHRVLELLDLARCDSVEAVEAQVAGLVEGKALTEAEVARANWAGIHWFLWQSAVGLRVVEAARRAAGGGVQVRREIPFVWVAGGSGDPADMPTVRGVIDLLVADMGGRRAEIVDYKTDSVRLWEGRVEDYRRQMGYYLAAASDILGYPVGRATLVFLAARREVELTG